MSGSSAATAAWICCFLPGSIGVARPQVGSAAGSPTRSNGYAAHGRFAHPLLCPALVLWDPGKAVRFAHAVGAQGIGAGRSGGRRSKAGTETHDRAEELRCTAGKELMEPPEQPFLQQLWAGSENLVVDWNG